MLKDAQVPEEAFLLENIMRTDVIKMATQSHANISSKGVLKKPVNIWTVVWYWRLWELR